MKKIILICAAGAFLSTSCSGITQTHAQNIRRAISRLRSTISNETATAYYDFAAILEEIKIVQPEAERLKLMGELVAPLFDVQEGQWKEKDCTAMTREKNYLLRLALENLIGNQHTVFKWECHLNRLKSMKKELALYADAPNPDIVRAASWLRQKEDFKREHEKLRAQSNEKVLIISRMHPPPKEWRDADDRWGYKKWLESSIRSYERENFDALKFKADYKDLPDREKRPLMEKVRKELGRYPDWYRDEKETPAK